jgi:hypothetical protein
VNNDPGREFERGDIPQEKSEIAVRLLRLGQKRTARAESFSERAWGLTPDDVYRGRQRVILIRREKIKRLTLERREEENLSHAAWPQGGARTLSKKRVRLSEKT